MARLRLELDAETFKRLTQHAVADRRPVAWQAEVLLRRALGLPLGEADDPEGSCRTDNGTDGDDAAGQNRG